MPSLFHHSIRIISGVFIVMKLVVNNFQFIYFVILGSKTLISDLQNQKHQLEQFASRFKNSNRNYLIVKSIAEQVVDRLLRERKSLLTSALVAVVEGLRMNPDRYAVIYNNKYDNDGNDNVFDSSRDTIAAASISCSLSTSTSSKPHSSTKIHLVGSLCEYSILLIPK